LLIVEMQKQTCWPVLLNPEPSCFDLKAGGGEPSRGARAAAAAAVQHTRARRVRPTVPEHLNPQVRF
jgi:hypothetical protein